MPPVPLALETPRLDFIRQRNLDQSSRFFSSSPEWNPTQDPSNSNFHPTPVDNSSAVVTAGSTPSASTSTMNEHVPTGATQTSLSVDATYKADALVVIAATDMNLQTLPPAPSNDRRRHALQTTALAPAASPSAWIAAPSSLKPKRMPIVPP